jgi:hypothetical protein
MLYIFRRAKYQTSGFPKVYGWIETNISRGLVFIEMNCTSLEV